MKREILFRGWSNAPEWAKLKAMDQDGRWFWLEGEPEIDDELGIWKTPLNSELIPNHPGTDKDWKQTLEQRPHQLFHIAIHEAVSTAPDPYQVDWSKAPEWADVHCWDKDGMGYWYGAKQGGNGWCNEYASSEFTLPAGLDWKKSKTRRP